MMQPGAQAEEMFEDLWCEEFNEVLMKHDPNNCNSSRFNQYHVALQGPSQFFNTFNNRPSRA